MPVLKKKVGSMVCRSAVGGCAPAAKAQMTIAFVVRPQTLDEKHRFQAATDALLKEMVRQHLGRREQ